MNWPGAIAAAEPDRVALVLADSRLTYRELTDRAEHLAGVLAHKGCITGDTVAVIMGNTPEFFIAVWAAQISGLYYVPISEKLPVSERDYIILDSGAKIVLTNQKDCINSLPPCEWSGSTDLFTRTEGSDMLYTSGTTGRPKGVKKPLSGASLGSYVRRTKRARELFSMNAETVFLSPAPLHHAAPLRYAMTVQRLGGTVVAMTRFDAAAALDLIEQESVTHSQWVPTHFSRLLALPHLKKNPSCHVCAIHAGAPCPVDVKRRMIDWWGPILHEYYSGTEAVGFTHITSDDWLDRPGSVGRAFGSKIHILGDDGAELNTGETGRVFFAGANALSYHGDPEKTAAATSSHGWATMGDIGYIDEQGYLYLTDREAFTIISGGANIYPAEVENALMADPAIVDCAVFGVPDDEFGEAVQALVELVPGKAPSAEMALTIAQNLRLQIASYKLPRAIAFTDIVPRMDSGKIRKRELVKSYSDLVSRGYSTRAQETVR